MNQQTKLAKAVFLAWAALVIMPAPARATFHLMQIEQVIGGIEGDTTAQAVQLRMRSATQHLVAPSRIRVWDAAGQNPIVLVDFTTSVPNGTAGARILVSSTSFNAKTSPTAVANFPMANLIPASYLAAGSMTFETDNGLTIYWRLSWGGAAYTGPTTGDITNDSNGQFGPPFPGPLPSMTLQALKFQGTASAPSTTNANDYALTAGAAVFTNNAGSNFTVISTAPTGACCDDSNGVCTIQTMSACAGSGFRYGGDGSTCATINPPCVGPTGACCDDSSGACTEARTEMECTADGFRYGGDDSTCGNISPACTGPTGACCDEVVGVCTEGVTQAQCTAGGDRFGGAGSTCANIDPPCEEVRIRIVLEPVATGLASPIHVTHSHDGSGRLFIVDQAGLIRVVDASGQLLPTPFLDVTAKLPTLGTVFDERGLLGMAFHPDFATNGRFFIRYSAPRTSTGSEPCDLSGFNPGCHKEVLAEYLVVGDPATTNVADPGSERILFEVDEPQFNHNAGMVEFGPDGYLYFTLGDGGGAHDGLADGDPPGSEPSHGPTGNGQNIETPLGKLIRIDVDSPPDIGLEYAIPPDNPFVGTAGLDEIYAYGFRNPFRFSWDDGPGGTGELYLADVGQDLFEEIDIVELGGNYGWVIREGFECFDPFNPGTPPASCPTTGALGEPLLDPVSVYTHAEGGLAVLGGYVYRGTQFPDLVGKYVYGDFSADFGPTGRLYYFDTTGPGAFARREFRVHPEDNPIGEYAKGLGRDESGELYVCTSLELAPSGSTGTVYRITQPPAAPGAEVGGVDKPRFVSLTLPALGGQEAAIRVQLASLHHPTSPPPGTPTFSAFEGQFRYVNAFRDAKNQPVFTCPDSANFGTTYKCARLGCEPEFHDWDAALGGAVLHLTGDSVVPSSIYHAVVLASSCAGQAATCAAASDELIVRTGRWGDPVGPGNGPPDNIANVLDIGAVVDKVKDLATAFYEPRMWMKDRMPNPVASAVNVIDIGFTVDAVKNFAYPASFTIDACP
jgi:glucose/arabinose dehydrogenase